MADRFECVPSSVTVEAYENTVVMVIEGPTMTLSRAFSPEVARELAASLISWADSAETYEP